MPVLTHPFKAMGCPCELRLVYQQRTKIEPVLSSCLRLIHGFERKYSYFTEDSLVAEINRSAGHYTVAIDAEAAALFSYADACFEQSNGSFDITSGALRRVWKDRTTLPEDSELAAAIDLVGWWEVKRTRDTIFLPKRGMEIDLGGLVKEYAADAVAVAAREAGVTGGIVNLGGDVAVVGPPEDADGWSVGIANPSRSDEPVAVIELSSGAIATSGGYERFVEIEGQHFSHLIDARTGWPPKSLQAVSVIANEAVVAGAIASIALLKDEDEALSWLNESGARYLAVDSDLGYHGAITRKNRSVS